MSAEAFCNKIEGQLLASFGLGNRDWSHVFGPAS